MKHFFNGNIVELEDIIISPYDLGFTRGFAVFDFLKTYHGKPFKLSEHIDRLFHSADTIGLNIPWTKDEVKNWVLQTLEANTDGTEKFIKIIVSGGISKSMVPTNIPTIIILIDEAVIYPKEWYEKGAKVISVRHARYTPEAKSNNYIEGVRSTQEAQTRGAIEPIYYSDTQVFEASNSNIFAIIDNEVVTPKNNVLKGITRDVLLKILKLNIPVVERDFTFPELLSAQEVFLSASGKEIVPVVQIDEIIIGKGVVGEITKEITKQFYAYTDSNTW